MLRKILVLTVILSAIWAKPAVAVKYWFDIGSNWYIYFDNGQTYIRSSYLPSNAVNQKHSCSHGRVQMSKTYGDDNYRKNMYAYILAGYTTRKSLSIVLDDGQSTCEFFGAKLY